MPTKFKGISNNCDRLHPQFARTGAVLPYYWLGSNEREIKEMATSYCYFFLKNVIILVRVRPKRSPSWSRSRYFQDGVGVGAGVA